MKIFHKNLDFLFFNKYNYVLKNIIKENVSWLFQFDQEIQDLKFVAKVMYIFVPHWRLYSTPRTT